MLPIFTKHAQQQSSGICLRLLDTNPGQEAGSHRTTGLAAAHRAILTSPPRPTRYTILLGTVLGREIFLSLQQMMGHAMSL